MNLDETERACPFCGECITLLIDPSGGAQTYTEDCSVCCQPIRVSLNLDATGELSHVEVEQENG